MERQVQDSPGEIARGSADEIALLDLLREQPRAGAAALYDRYGRVVFSVALRMVGDRGVAEEITQDVFVGCWRTAGRYRREQGSVLSWLLGITHHRAIDELRSRRYQSRKHEVAWDEHDLHGFTLDPDFDLQALQTVVRAALSELPQAQREVIELLYFGGLTRQEAADRLHAPLGTIHTRLRLGFAKLRGTLAHLRDESAADELNSQVTK
jgi:RNA polymerase sigma-70 factor (ECF subfamily)